MSPQLLLPLTFPSPDFSDPPSENEHAQTPPEKPGRASSQKNIFNYYKNGKCLFKKARPKTSTHNPLHNKNTSDYVAK